MAAGDDSTPNSFGASWSASRTEAQQLIDELTRAGERRSRRQGVSPGRRRRRGGGRRPAARFVGRGGEKLDHALDAFDVDVTACRALDVGASTGGFTDCLLQRGAAHVVALDVGHGQLHERLRADDRVDESRTHATCATLDRDAIGGPVDIVVGDLSFISLRLVDPDPLRVGVPTWGTDGPARQAAVRSWSSGGRARGAA